MTARQRRLLGVSLAVALAWSTVVGSTTMPIGNIPKPGKGTSKDCPAAVLFGTHVLRGSVSSYPVVHVQTFDGTEAWCDT